MLCLSHQLNHPTESHASLLLSVSAPLFPLPALPLLVPVFSHLDVHRGFLLHSTHSCQISLQAVLSTLHTFAPNLQWLLHYVQVEISFFTINTLLIPTCSYTLPSLSTNLLHSCQPDLLVIYSYHVCLPLILFCSLNSPVNYAQVMISTTYGWSGIKQGGGQVGAGNDSWPQKGKEKMVTSV